MNNGTNDTTITLLDAWVLNKFLTSKTVMSAFTYVVGNDGILLITERLARNKVRCTLIEGTGYSSIVTRKIRVGADGKNYIALHGSKFCLSEEKGYKASSFVKGHVKDRLKAIESEYQLVDDGIIGRRKVKQLNLQKALLIENFKAIA